MGDQTCRTDAAFTTAFKTSSYEPIAGLNLLNTQMTPTGGDLLSH
jgi:hypothetical protein